MAIVLCVLPLGGAGLIRVAVSLAAHPGIVNQCRVVRIIYCSVFYGVAVRPRVIALCCLGRWLRGEPGNYPLVLHISYQFMRLSVQILK